MILRGQLRPLVRADDVELRFDAPGAPLALRTDEDKLMQVLRNLVSNALKFTPHGEVRRARRSATATRVRFEVADTGIGIAPADLPRIFDEFVQIPGELQRAGTAPGSGCRWRASSSGCSAGEIDVASTVGAGTTFTVSLPLTRRRGAGRAARPDRRGARRRRRRGGALRGRGPPARHGVADGGGQRRVGGARGA